MSRLKILFIPVLLAVTAGCTVSETEAPPLMGPSELALRIALQALPDSILQDGFSQTVINIDASGVDGRPVRGLPLRVEIIFQGETQDFGTLSAKTVVTGDDGRARVIYTAPPRPAEPVDFFTTVTIFVTPIGNDHRGEIQRTVDIRLVPPGVILPPNSAPTAQFTFQPLNPLAFDTVTFDASASTDPDLGGPCLSACTYSWDFGDGTTGTGIFATHVYRRIGTFQVRLTVTDQRGAFSQTAQSLTVGPTTPPTATFSFSPTSPAINQTIFFTAEASRAVPGRRIVSYDWNFGTGRNGTGVTTSKAYDAPGTYPVTLTVTDDVGEQGTNTQNVPISIPGGNEVLTARLTVSPGTGNTGTNFFLDASGSTRGPSPIVEYRFTFGDTTPDVVGASPTTTHRYSTSGNYVARVTIRDSAGRTATTTTNVTVQ